MYITTRRVDNIIIVCCVQDQCLDEVFSELGKLTISLLQSQIKDGAAIIHPPQSRTATFKTNLSQITEGEILTSITDSNLSKDSPMPNEDNNSNKLPTIIEDNTLGNLIDDNLTMETQVSHKDGEDDDNIDNDNSADETNDTLASDVAWLEPTVAAMNTIHQVMLYNMTMPQSHANHQEH
jgi:hypothetical protein